MNERDADENERGQKAYVVSRLKDGKIMTAKYAQTHNYVYIFPYKTEQDDDDCFDVEDDKHGHVKIPDTETESDEEMSTILQNQAALMIC